MLETQAIVVMGAAGLIGQQVVKCCLANGARVVAADIHGPALTELANSLANELLVTHVVDLTSTSAVKQSLQVCIEQFGEVTALVNAAYPRNKQYGKPFFEVAYEDFCENISLNIATTFLASQIFAEYFVKQKSGSIINFGSIYGVMAPEFEIYKGTTMTVPVEYAAIKSAVIHLTRYMANYLRNDGVRVNCISPGGILDGQPESFLGNYQHKAGTIGMLSPEHLDSSVLYLLSPDSNAVTGQNIVVDDGFSL